MDVVFIVVIKSFNFKDGFTFFVLWFLDILDHIPANHKTRNISRSQITDIMRAHMSSGAHDGDPVAESHDLIDLMGDEYDGISIVLQHFELIKQLVCLLRSKHSCRLVKNDQLGIPEQYLEYLCFLFLTNRDVTHQLVCLDVESVFLSELVDFFDCVLPIEKDTVVRFRTDNDILSNRERIRQIKVLIDHSDPKSNCCLR